MNAVEAGLYTQLVQTGTSLYTLVGTKVYNQVAPQNTAFPYVMFQLQGGGDMNETPTDRLELVYLVKGLSGAVKTAGQVDDAIRSRLHKQSFTISGYSLLGCKRESVIHYTEVVNGKIVFHSGALYRIVIV